MNETLIRLEHVSLYYPTHKKWILKEINWEINRGERWILFGRNGSGKSRLLEIMSGYLYPSRGRVLRFVGEDKMGDIREKRKHMGYVSTGLREKFNYSHRICDFVESGFYATIGMFEEEDREIKDKAFSLLDTAGLAHRSDDPFYTLSDGEKQKVLLLRAFISQPEVLILDEPAAGLDIAAREDLLASLERLSTVKSCSIIYVTHHLEEITPFFNRLLILDEGTSLFCGDIEKGIDGGFIEKVFDQSVRILKHEGRFYSILNNG